MPNFDTHKIEALFSLCLAKAKVTRSRADYVQLSEEINNKKLLEAANITQKYLDESIDKGLDRARDKNLEKLGLNKDYVTALAVYLGYETYRAFETAFNQAQQLLSQITIPQFQIFYSKEKKDEAAVAIASLPYPEQAFTVEIASSEIPEEMEFFEADKKRPLVILWVDQALVRQQQPELDETEAAENLLFVAVQNEEGVTTLIPITQLQLAISFQILANDLTVRERAKKEKLATHNRPIAIKDSSAINLGTIKARYISGRDMTINIKKKK
jgi:hypothetical protein